MQQRTGSARTNRSTAPRHERPLQSSKRSNLSRMVTRERLIALLQIQGEADELDFKAIFDLSSKRAKAEFARDALGALNTDGGMHIVFGVQDNTFVPLGLGPGDRVDTTTIYKALASYIDGDIPCVAAAYDLRASDLNRDGEWEGTRRFGLVFIARRPGIARPGCDAAFPDAKGRMESVLQVSDVLVRRGAQTVLANTDDLRRLFGQADNSGQDNQDTRDTQDGDEVLEETVPVLISTLPAPEAVATHFVGRRQELDVLRSWFNDPQSRLWLLAGDGGKGKSAIAYEFASAIRASAPPDLAGVLWVSAKRRRFVDGAVQPIVHPDFSDLATLLDAIALAYGYTDYLQLPVQEKRQKVKELLDILPVLLVADDIDSLEGTGDDAFMFLIAEAINTHSKILLTSRDVKFGLNTLTTQVTGFTREDGEAFISSRIRLFRLDPNVFPPRIVRDILDITDGSPLYIEDLLRLCAVLPLQEALDRWREQRGAAAREYALKREFDRLPDAGKKVVIAACLFDGPVSFVELQRVTGLPEAEMEAGIEALQKLFLVSRPRLIEGVQRYDVNVNTRTLVRDTQKREHPEMFRQLSEAYRQVRQGALGNAGDWWGGAEIGSAIRQASALQSLGRIDEAEQTIRAALVQYPDHASLIAQLGLLALGRPQANPTDARAHFQRAAQLNCHREAMYVAWAELEEREYEWQAALNAAGVGIERVGRTPALLFHAGYARSRLGQRLLRELHNDRAERELVQAKNDLRQALRETEDLTTADMRRLNPRILRELVLTAEALCRINRSYVSAARDWAKRWRDDYPEGRQVQEIAARILTRYPARAQRPESETAKARGGRPPNNARRGRTASI